ncbi:GNAT family N-acetyltransferase [Terriglobus sp. 2YAB30_2]|uniref:GNAT family N-acetyltransferase n=1 Tax=unclassified Terriglobus TaxID=2628988 RepID=UPI003F9B0998
MRGLVFKEASSAEEIDQIERLNHQTFAEEIQQHAPRENGRLPDRFHATNRYFIALRDGKLQGMISANTTPPFSTEKRLPAKAAIYAFGTKPCEVRMLAVTPQSRGGMVLAGLFWKVYDFARRDGCTHLLISGVVERLDMYRSVGFEALGPPVPDGDASFVPMALSLEKLPAGVHESLFRRWWQTESLAAASLGKLFVPAFAMKCSSGSGTKHGTSSRSQMPYNGALHGYGPFILKPVLAV